MTLDELPDDAWDRKLGILKERLRLTDDGLASALGITTRTLQDFVKRENPRPPSEPIQKLIDLLLDDSLIKQPETNLVIIHGDFSVPEMIVKMHNAGNDGQRNNEFHYIAVDSEHYTGSRYESIRSPRLQIHSFAGDALLTSNQAKDCYFTMQATWLAVQAVRRNLKRITIAADIMKFWPLANELRGLLDSTEVAFAVDAKTHLDQDKRKEIIKLGINIFDVSDGRMTGFVSKLKDGIDGTVAYGFINPPDLSVEAPAFNKPIFFSYNHMKKGRDGISDETPISKLNIGDRVSFKIGFNNKGACATDVALVERRAVSPSELGVESNEEDEFITIVKEAIDVCADETGRALFSNVGSRISVLYPDYENRLHHLGYNKLSELAKKHFDYSDRHIPPYKAPSIRRSHK